MRVNAIRLTVIAALVLAGSSVVPAHAAGGGAITISCKTQVRFGAAEQANDCVGTASGIVIAPDGNVIVITGDPTWASQKATNPCNDVKGKPGKCYDNFRAFDLFVDETGPTNPATASAYGRFEVKGVDTSKGNAPVVINGTFEYTRVGVHAVVTIPGRAPKDSKGKGTNAVQIKEAGKDYGPCPVGQGGGAFQFIPKEVPVDGAKSTVWVTGTASFVC